MSLTTPICPPIKVVEDHGVDHIQSAGAPLSTDTAELERQIIQYSTKIKRVHQLQRRSLTRMKPKALESTFVQISSLTEQTQKLSTVIKTQLMDCQHPELLEKFRAIVHRHRQAQIFFYQEYRIYDLNRTMQLLQSGQNINQLTSLMMELDGEECNEREDEDLDEDTMVGSYISFGPFVNESAPAYSRKQLSWALGGVLFILAGFWILLDQNVVSIEFMSFV